MRRNLQCGFLALVVVALAATAAQAQTDFSGEWTVVRSMDNTENPWVGDWVGMPFNPDGIARAESWDPSLLSLPEYQCRPHGWPYIYRGPTALRITKEVDPFTREVVAFHPEWHQSTNMPVYVDGRDRPSADVNHTWGGFSVGTWEGDMLKIKTTHIKEDYIRRNGAMASDQTTVTTYWIRRGDILTWVNIIRDPIYLAEPLIRSSEYRLTVNSQVPAHPCTAAFEGLEKGAVPHYLPNENPFLKDIRSRYGLPVDQPTAGPATMYPEYQKQLRPSTWTTGDKRAVADPNARGGER